MARRPLILEDGEELTKPLERHILALGFGHTRDYYNWCWANGFDGLPDKSRADMQEEAAAFEAALTRRKKHARLHKKPKAFLEAVCRGELSSDQIERPNFKRTAQEIESSNEAEESRESLLQMLMQLTKHDDAVFQTVAAEADTPFVRGFVKLHDRKALWLRPLEDWKPGSKNLERRFGELTHHLFDKYGDVPRFMERVWLRNDRPSWRFRDWYVHLGRGHNLRTAKSPIPLTKKMVHHFLRGPDDYTVEQAIRWGQLQALGAGKHATHAVAATRLGRSFENEEFWFTVLRFVAENPMLDPRQIGPIIDYLQNQRFDPTEIQVAPGEWRQEPPPQPGLSMHGRTVGTLLRQVEEWHESLRHLRGLGGQRYDSAPFEGITVEKKLQNRSVQWVIRQLRSAQDLQLEGDELNHCVASYHWSCTRGDCTIWSLSRTEDFKTYERRQTIEVDRGGRIVQCRGLANRDPDAGEWSVVEAWARKENLAVATYF
ncbi:MAG: PcfJ domain-containing protein [Pseudomonadota bacterium]